MERRSALVTGASSGIGAAYARRLAADGFALTLVARREEKLRALASELERAGVPVALLPCDLSSEAGIAAACARIEEGPALDLLVSGAGFGTRGLFAEIAPERSEAMVRLHVLAGVRLTRAALPAMLARGRGAVVHVASLGAFFTTSRYVTYSATKAFLTVFCEGLADEVSASGVKVQALCPGLTRGTEFLESPEYAEFHYQGVPARFWITAEEVVARSLAGLERGGPTLVIPGLQNRALVALLQAPILGGVLRRGIAGLGRRGLY
jgi:short-subunit dehydrogenase